MPPRKFLPRNPKALVLAVLVALIPVGTGIGMLHWQVDRSLRAAVEQDTARSVHELDRILSLAAHSAERLLPLAGQACDDVVQTLRQEVTREPHIRSANLVTDGQAYCSSLYGHYSMPVMPADYLNGRLWLRAGNVVTPHAGSLVYRLSQDDKAVRAVIDGRMLAETLRLIGDEATLILQVGDAFLWSGGSIENGEIPDHQDHHMVKQSAVHGYLIHGGYPAGMARTLFKREAVAMLGSLLLLGVLTGGVCHWLFNRDSRPARQA